MPVKMKDDIKIFMSRPILNMPKIIIVLLCCLLPLLFYSKENRAADITLSNYAIEKIDEINDMVLRREAVPESYLYYLKNNEALLENIENYNQWTGILMADFTSEALNIVCVMCGLTDEDGSDLYGSALDYTKLPSEVHILVDKIARYALYENCDELIAADPSLEQIRVGEIGGSMGMWPNWLHGRMFIEGNESRLENYQNYQELIKEILIQFEAQRLSA